MMCDKHTETDGFAYELFEFYRNLAAQQEPLPKEFQDVLYDNMEDLLVRTE